MRFVAVKPAQVQARSMVLRTRGLLVRQLTVGRLAQGQALQGRTKMCGTSLPPRPMIIQKPSPPRGTTRFGSPFDAMVEICGKADSLGEVIGLLDAISQGISRLCRNQGEDPFRGPSGPSDQSHDDPVRTVCRSGTRAHLRTHPGGLGQGQSLGEKARAPKRAARDVTTRRKGGREPEAPGPWRLQERCGRDHRSLPTDLVRTTTSAPAAFRHPQCGDEQLAAVYLDPGRRAALLFE